MRRNSPWVWIGAGMLVLGLAGCDTRQASTNTDAASGTTAEMPPDTPPATPAETPSDGPEEGITASPNPSAYTGGVAGRTREDQSSAAGQPSNEAASGQTNADRPEGANPR